MSDLNEWRLRYYGCDLTFGTLDSDFPFSAQVEVGEPDVEIQDTRHPTSDGVVMGRDSLGGMTLGFNMTILPEFPIPSQPWNSALDAASALKSMWRADNLRRSPGAYASLLNVNRDRLVYGRPRKMATNLAKARKGIVGLVGTFETNGPDFYSGTEKVAILSAASPSGGGFHAPLRPPFSFAQGQSVLATTNNNGDLDTWPIIKFRGPGTEFSLECFSGATVVWKLVVIGSIHTDEVLTVDTRPWSRSAVIDGNPANGRIKGTQLEFCRIPIGDFNLRFRVKDRSGQAFADVKWRDAYASL